MLPTPHRGKLEERLWSSSAKPRVVLGEELGRTVQSTNLHLSVSDRCEYKSGFQKSFEVQGGPLHPHPCKLKERLLSSRAKRKVLANIENHKQEHKRWVNVWRNAHRTCTYIVQLLYYNNVTLHHCVTVVCGKVERVDSRAQGAEYKSCKPCKRCC